MRWVCAALACVSIGAARAADLRLGMNVRADMAADERRQSLQTAAARIDLDAGIAFDSGWTLSALARLRGDREDRLEPGRPSQHERSSMNRRWILNDDVDAELRELYLDGRIGPAFVRIGKQQVVWGQADGLRVLDVVNPFSFREFIWPEPQDRRIPLWTVKTEVPIGATTLQLLWIPDATYDELPRADAAFAITTPLLIPRSPVPVPVAAPRRPSGLAAGDAGARFAAFVGGWDITLNYLYHYYDDPVPFVIVTTAGPTVVPAYERTRLTGLTFSNAFGSTTIRGEIGHSTNRWFVASADADRVFPSDEVAFVIGLDNTALTDTLISAQYFESRVLDPVSSMTRSRTERQATLVLQRAFRNDSIKLRALWLTSLNRHDGGLQARLSWQAGANVTLGISTERFYGDREGLFGEFRDASRAGIDVQWSWSQRPQ